MKRIIKRSAIVMLIVLTTLLCSSFLARDFIYAENYQASSAWTGEDVGVEPLNGITFDSDFRPFSTVISDYLLVDTNKKYVIETAYDLYMFSELARGDYATLYLSLDYVLGTDIDYFDALQENITYLFTPVGFNYPFTGTFDGQGYEITNLIFRSVNSTDDYDTYMPGLIYYSMFSRTSETAVIENLGLINPLIVQAIEEGAMTHVSVLVGENKGLVRNVYYLDNRGDSSGINAEGNFFISGLVSRNIGTISNAFVATPHVRSLAIINNLVTAVLVYSNTGTLENLYYDSDVYQDESSTSTTNGVGLSTSSFQNHSYFSSDWYFQDSYMDLTNNPNLVSQTMITNTYPVLQGVDVENQTILIKDAVDFVYMNELLIVSGLFRASHYVITHDIDMNQVSRKAYQAASVGFSGSLTSTLANSESTLYPHMPAQGGSSLYHTIIGLKISETTFIGNYASYALFSSLFGSIEHLNFWDFTINPENIIETANRDKVLIGGLAASATKAMINDVHLKITIDVPNITTELGQMLVGGMIAEGSATIDHASTAGMIAEMNLIYNTRSNQSAVAGIVAHSMNVLMTNSLNNIDIAGLSYTNMTNGVTYYGGLFGYGTLNILERVVNDGNIKTHTSGFVNETYLGGIIGYQENLLEHVLYTYNSGNITQTINRAQKYHVAGYGSVEDIDDDLDMVSLANSGLVHLDMMSSMLTSDLQASEGYVSGVLISYANGDITGLFQSRNQSLDLSGITYFGGTLLALDQTDLTLQQAYQTGDIDFYSSNTLAHDTLHVSLNAYGKNLTQVHLRQEGDATFYISHDTASAITNGSLYIYGVIEEVSQDFYARDLFNGGHISINKNSGADVVYSLYIGGIGYHNRNTNLYMDHNIDHSSIDIETIDGSLDTVLNSGDITVRGGFDGHVKVAGILVMNGGLLTNAINIGDIDIRNDAQTSDDQMEAAGIVYLMTSEYAQVRDAANNGDVIAVSTTSVGYTHAAGIVMRNDLNEDLSVISSSSDKQLGKIMFSVNYGNIYAYNGTNESSYTITSETRSKASSIFGIGLLSVVNNFNFGNVYSRYLGAGIFGFIYYNRFGAITNNQVYISNNINYGKVRQVTGYNKNSEVFTYSMSTTPNESEPYAFGAIVGKIHNGSTSWTFLGDTTYAIDRIYFGYLLNFDEKINMFASAPAPTSSWYNLLGGDSDDANAILLQMLEYMATTNPNDESAAPFTRFQTSGWIYGEFSNVITYLNVSESEDGMFYENFGFRSQRPVFSGTDQYIADYIDYIPANKVNDHILTMIEADTTYDYPGIYALASSSGIGNGIFIPDNFKLDGLHPYHIQSSTPETDWIGVTTDTSSISYALYEEMRQIKASFATTIYNLDIVQTDLNGNPIEDGLTLSNPVIDDQRGLLTYYLPSNALILNGATANLTDITTYTEAGPNVSGVRVVPEIPGSGTIEYAYIGTHQKVGMNMETIGPYASTGRYHIVSQQTYGYPYDETSQYIPVYDWKIASEASGPNVFSGDLFDHVPTTRTRFWFISWYDAIGYSVQTYGGTQSPGYGAYRRINYTYSWGTTIQIYDYVGPNPVLESYVYSGQMDDVAIYNESPVRFKANTEADSFMISENASLTYNGSDQQTLVSIPRAYGIYESMYEGTTYVDSVSDHYGSVRVFSASYNPTDPSTYRDYEIRVIRTADESITDLAMLHVNGIDALALNDNYADATSTVDLYYEYDGTNGAIVWAYDTYNIPDLYYITPLIELFDNNTQVKVNSSYYRLTQGIVQTEGVFNNQTGSWGIGYVETKFIIEDDFPSGNYTLRLTLVSGATFEITFDKMESANAAVLEIVYQEEVIETTGMSYTSEIPYGIYYQPGNDKTNIVNFTNLSVIDDVYYTDVALNLPDYLEGLTLSTFTTIDNITLSITIINGYQHQYAIVYHLVAEDGSQSTFTHYLIEAALSVTPQNIYKNGGVLSSVYDPVDIGYEESPTMRVAYNFDEVFFPGEDVLFLSAGFTPDNLGEVATENQDYYMQTIDAVGYEVDFSRDTPKGEYTFHITYDNDISLWGETIVWHYVMNPIYANKLPNDNSHLTNILFASESVFDEVLDAFNTIIEVDEVTPLEYEQYYDPENPTQREIVALPTTGIDYDIYYDYQAYWVVGQVQQTNLSAYLPTFYIPENAMIYRVIDETNIGYEYQSGQLAADFADYGTGESLNYVHYRIYAEDYDDYPTHYTDYYIAVQDTTNNIKFDVTVINETNDRIDEVFVHVNVAQVSIDYEGEITNEMIAISMNLFSYYNPITMTYSNNQFMTSMYGRYMVYADLPDGYDVDIEFQQAFIDGSSMYLESSRIPRRYYVTVHIIEDIPETHDWGYRKVYEFALYENELLQGITYHAGDRFLYNHETYEVQEGYTYLFNGSNTPGTFSAIGIKNVDLDYDMYSTYLTGDIVYHNGAYYQALDAVIQNITPDQTSVDMGTWYEFSEAWLSYNHYSVGSRVFYNGNYYIAILSNHNADPELNPTLWELEII